MKKHFKHVFGPVPSRRLGFSLGIDVVPFKTCSYDCIYCQLGRTTRKTLAGEDFVPVSELLHELQRRLDDDVTIDYITVSGSGEPTLYTRLGELIEQVKHCTGIPVAVLTNGSLFWDRNVRKNLLDADLVIPSLDAGNENIFRYVNRPCRGLDFRQVTDGLIQFSRKFKNKIWLEVFLLNGVTSIQSKVREINTIIQKIKPAKVHLNTVQRPPAESFAFQVPPDLMREAAGCINGNVEIIADFSRKTHKKYFKYAKNEILNLLKRRPCTLADISGVLNLHKNEILKYTEELLENDEIVTYGHNNTRYYSGKRYR